LQKLNNAKYTRADVAKQAESIAILHQKLRLTISIGEGTMFDCLLQVYYHFETSLRVTLILLDPFTTMESFVRQLINKRGVWFEQYKAFGKQTYSFVLENRQRDRAIYPTYTPTYTPRTSNPAPPFPQSLPPPQSHVHFVDQEKKHDNPYSY